jgi:hypothetical protein
MALVVKVTASIKPMKPTIRMNEAIITSTTVKLAVRRAAGRFGFKRGRDKV